MNSKFQILVVAVVTVGLAACGGDAEVESYDCGEGTVEYDGECIPDIGECDDGEVHDEELGRCVRAVDDYCGEGTEFDDELGKCVGESVECAPNTAEEDGECVPESVVTCGEGTVAVDGQCRFEDDVCGDNTELEEGACQPTEDACGDGTVFDVAARQCIPVDDVECGAGTRELEGECVAHSAYYEQMSEDADVQLSGGVASVTLPDQNEQLTFTGTIEAPQTVDGELVAHEDVMEFDADVGDWLEITVYSMGLPKPGFRLEHTGDDVQFQRYSDYITASSTQRQVLISHDGTHQLAVSNLPQLVGDEISGGDDWDYVGTIEVVDAPDATDAQLYEDAISGDILELRDNFYSVNADGAQTVAVMLDQLPADADAELQVWADPSTHHQSYPLQGAVVGFEPPSDDFYLVVDRIHAAGEATDYSMTARQAQPLDAGDSITVDVDLEPGDYVGLFQYNDKRAALDAELTVADETVESDTLEVSTGTDWPLALYHYTEDTETVTLTITNSSGQDLDTVVLHSVVGTADEIDSFDGTLVETDYNQPLPRGHRHYYELDVEFDDWMSARIEGADGDALVQLFQNDELLREEVNQMMPVVSHGDYLLVVEALETLEGGFTLELEERQQFFVTETSSPSAAIPDGGEVTDTITVGMCPTILDIEVEVSIGHSWIGDITVDLIAPSGFTANLHDRSGSSTNDINATYPYPGDSNYDDGEDLLDLIGESGTGDWTLNPEDHLSWYTGNGILNSWTLILECEG